MRRFCLAFMLGACGIAITPKISAADPLREPRQTVITEKSTGVHWTVPIGHRRGIVSVGNDKVVVATNEVVYAENGSIEKRLDGGSLVCIDRSTGERLWQRDHPRRGDAERPRLGIQSQPRIHGQQLYYISNRGELVCAELKNGDVRWMIDMVADLDICFSPDFALSNPFCRPLIYGDYVYVVTGNGSTHSSPMLAKSFSWEMVPRPDSPHFLCADKRTGEIVWTSAAPDKNVVHSWSSPIACKIAEERNAILFPGGDGVLYFFDPFKGSLLYEHNMNPPKVTQWSYSFPGSRVFFVASPVSFKGDLYVGTAQDMYGYSKHASLAALKCDRVKQGNNIERWRLGGKDFGWLRASPVATDTRVFAFDEKTSELVVIDRSTGKVKARRESYDSEPNAFNSLCLMQEVLVLSTGATVEIYTVSDEPELLNVLTFRHGVSTTSTGLIGPVVISGDDMFVAADAHVFALDARAVVQRPETMTR